ncbi:hypothetical protein RND71_014058 [Anisodus tanguticus]|uniref:Pantoate--beta-alanine ligase n=1 Tax=Anisodus tanguticus TaxID=243964 RepID=A0AAE1S961_9SOLA|nr:hypothetical protein RND71_014058 [Anisodus tanguticus]
MGYLHEGHLSLIQEAHKHTNLIVVSIYVNPGQFSPNEDLSTYSSDFQGDIKKLKTVCNGVDVLFNPKNMYEYGIVNLEMGLRGIFKKGSWHVFFRGVATVVTKLFNIVEPDVVVFGKKDYQQWRIIQRMVRDLDFGIKVIGSEIVREHDGLAMCSGNVKLSPENRQKALSISPALSRTKVEAEKGQVNCRELINCAIQTINEAGGRVDYAEVRT